MFVSIDKVYCKHWLCEADITLEYIYPYFDLSPHKALDLRDSIHYKALQSNDYSTYNQLVISTKQVEHSESIFRMLKETFNSEEMDPIKIYWESKIGKFIILDGVHRACLLLYYGLVTDTFPAKFLQLLRNK